MDLSRTGQCGDGNGGLSMRPLNQQGGGGDGTVAMERWGLPTSGQQK